MSDSELLRLYATGRSESVFSELVHRHVDLVHSAAARQLGGDVHRANDVAQLVFAELAGRAEALSHHPALIGWLYTTTRFVAAKTIRAEHRRRAREAAHVLMHDSPSPSSATVDWERLRLVLDEAMHRLNERERHALLLRFFGRSSLAEVGAALGLSENAAQKTVDRTLAKLRDLLVRRGFTSTSATLAVLLETQAVVAAPASLAASIAASATLGTAGTVAGSSGIFAIMTTAKLTFAGAAALGLAGVLLVSSLGWAGQEVRAARHAFADADTAREAVAAREAEVHRLDATAQATDRRLAALRAKTAAMRAQLASAETTARPGLLSASASATAAPRDPRADGRAFLAAIGDEGRAQLAEFMRLQVRQNYAPILRELDLPAAQVAEFEARTVRHMLEHLHVTPEDIAVDPEDNALDDDAIVAIFGAEGFQRLQDAERKGPARDWAATLALKLNLASDAPVVSADQIVALANLVAEGSPEFRSGRDLDLNRVDWPAVLAGTRQVLTEPQWQLAQPWLQRQQVERELAALKAPQTPSGKP